MFHLFVASITSIAVYAQVLSKEILYVTTTLIQQNVYMNRIFRTNNMDSSTCSIYLCFMFPHTNKAVEQNISNSIQHSESYEHLLKATKQEYYKPYCIVLCMTGPSRLLQNIPRYNQKIIKYKETCGNQWQPFFLHSKIYTRWIMRTITTYPTFVFNLSNELSSIHLGHHHL